MSTVFDEQPDLGDQDLPNMDLEDRHALRRVAGLSTELQDVSEVEYRALRLERVVLIGVWAEGSLASAENSLRELSRLAETAGSEVLDGLIQRRSRIDAATYVGSGKARELAGIVAAAGADTVICDGELTPSQLRNLEGVVHVKVIDRTALILDIFAQHARSREGKAQVELAQLQYMLPRLRGWGESLSRQAGGRVAGGGGIGTRGPGETKIETDRRRLRARISRLQKDITDMSTGRKVQRGQRRRRAVPSVVIAGYTNAGKSSLLNVLTGAGVLVEDALFATLDPAVRRAATPSGRTFTLTETGAEHVPEFVVVNKIDSADPVVLQGLRAREPGSLSISAKTGAGLAALRDAVEAALPRLDVQVKVTVPYSRGDLLATEHIADGTLLQARVPPALAAKLEAVLDDCVQVQA